MKKILDPLATSGRIEHDYRSYLSTTFAPRDPLLRSDFESAMAEPERVLRGPIVQATPPYTPGSTMSELVDAGVLHPDFTSLDTEIFPPERPLYLHQQQALESASSGRNLVVATGTGSGKTECYLFPILNHLLEERSAGTLEQPGVRALLLYPMNALANDQMKRIRSLFEPYPEITFGRYTGETEHQRDRAVAKFRDQLQSEPPPGELLDRQSIQASPPHVLLTNFAMLEYLLLRPQDSSLFDGPTGRHWSFIVLDEVHVYDGAKGAEIGMLLRRVRDRVNQTTRGRLQCFGTSATLGKGVEDSERVASFATALFDEAVESGDVVHPSRLTLSESDATWMLTEHQLSSLHEAWLGQGDALALAESIGREAAAGRSVEQVLVDLLHAEHHVVALQERLEKGSTLLAQLAESFEGFVDREAAATKLIDLCIAARSGRTGAPLIPARYHLWLRASEGTFACLHSRHADAARRLSLDRHESCPSCLVAGRQSKMFEVGVCRHCRQHYLVGHLDENNAVGLAPSHERKLVHLLPEQVGEADVDTAFDEDEAAQFEVEDAGQQRHTLCLECGALSSTGGACDCGVSEQLAVTLADTKDASGAMKRCIACHRHSPHGVVQRFLSGSEAPVAVIATSLYQSLPPVSDAPDISAEGRKLLMFSDSRQDAAFFAPYLGRTYNRAIERRMLWTRLSAESEPFLFDDLIQPIRRDAERAGLLDEERGRSNLADVAHWVLAEVLATDRRQSIDGLGLVELVPKLPRGATAPSVLTDGGLSETEALDVVRVLLESLRHGGAVSVPDNVNVREDPRFGPRNTTTFVRGLQSEPRVLAWSPGRGKNRRLDYLEKLGLDHPPGQTSLSALAAIWDDLTAPSGPFASVLSPRTEAKLGTVFTLNHERIEFGTPDSGATPFQCETCRQITWRSVRRVCPTYRCSGELTPLTDEATNHYASLYRNLDPLPLTISEHTGQLEAKHAAKLQEQFTRGELNALSCSTTFELGVDVGEVQAVLMRNVPPSPANYVQRAGRAGRRLGSAALVVTFAQRRNHDRHYFDNPAAMVDGIISPPVLVTDNESIIRRHVQAVAWADFDRERVDSGGAAIAKMGELLEEPDSIADAFVEWLDSKPQVLADALKRIVPAESAEAIGVETWDWANVLQHSNEAGFGGWLTLLIQGARSDAAQLRSMEAEAAAAKNYGRAKSLQRTQHTLDSRRVLDRFAQRGILPKYGFPVDVVDLDLSKSANANRVDLNRDLRLAILEFAPGSRVVADNRLWESKGIKHVSGQDLPQYQWGVCEGCGVLRTELVTADMKRDEVFADPCAHCDSESFQRGQRGRFLIPLFGFVGDLSAEQPGESRPPREGYLQTFFAEFDGPPPEFERVDLGGKPLGLRASRRGWITVFNRGRSGRGFSYCSWCGYAGDSAGGAKRSKVPTTHKKPWADQDCSGGLQPIDLGHRYLTNVLELHMPLGASSASGEHAALSSLYALISAAPALGVASGDIGGSLSVGPSGELTTVIFDDVPGGAGHTRFLRERLGELVETALQRVSECSCGIETSCYGCLRSYQNQREHDHLRRQDAIDVLSALLR